MRCVDGDHASKASRDAKAARRSPVLPGGNVPSVPVWPRWIILLLAKQRRAVLRNTRLTPGYLGLDRLLSFRMPIRLIIEQAG